MDFVHFVLSLGQDPGLPLSPRGGAVTGEQVRQSGGEDKEIEVRRERRERTGLSCRGFINTKHFNTKD